MTLQSRTSQLSCPLCSRKVPHLKDHLGVEWQDQVLQEIQEKNPHWSKKLGACQRCLNGKHKPDSAPGKIAQLQKRLKFGVNRRQFREMDTTLHRYRKGSSVA